MSLLAREAPGFKLRSVLSAYISCNVGYCIVARRSICHVRYADPSGPLGCKSLASNARPPHGLGFVVLRLRVLLQVLRFNQCLQDLGFRV